MGTVIIFRFRGAMMIQKIIFRYYLFLKVQKNAVRYKIQIDQK